MRGKCGHAGAPWHSLEADELAARWQEERQQPHASDTDTTPGQVQLDQVTLTQLKLRREACYALGLPVLVCCKSTVQ